MKLRLVTVAVLLAAVATSCGGSGRANPEGDPAVASVDPQFGLLPPSPPDGMRVDIAAAQPVGHDTATGFSALYADEDWMTSGDGRAAVVLMEMDYTSLPVDFEEAPTTTVGEAPAIEGMVGDLRYVAWQFCPPSGCDHLFEAAVVGHALTPAEILAIARSARFERDDSSVGWVPGDLDERARGPYAASGLWSMYDEFGPTATRLVLERRGHRPHETRIRIVTVSDPRQIHLVRFLLDVGPIAIRGTSGYSGTLISLGGPPGGDVSAKVWTWLEDGVQTLVQAQGVDDQVVVALIGDLEPATPATWQAMAERAAEVPTEPESDERIVASASVERGSWTIELSRHETGGGAVYFVSDSVRFADGYWTGSSTSPSLAEPRISFSSSDHGTLFFGALPNAYQSITITLDGGKTLAITPPLRAGWPARPWGAFTTGSERVTAVSITRDSQVAYVLAPESAQPDGRGGGSGLQLESTTPSADETNTGDQRSR